MVYSSGERLGPDATKRSAAIRIRVEPLAPGNVGVGLRRQTRKGLRLRPEEDPCGRTEAVHGRDHRARQGDDRQAVRESQSATNMGSSPQKLANPGRPTLAKVAVMNRAARTGAFCARPPIWNMSKVLVAGGCSWRAGTGAQRKPVRNHQHHHASHAQEGADRDAEKRVAHVHHRAVADHLLQVPLAMVTSPMTSTLPTAARAASLWLHWKAPSGRREALSVRGRRARTSSARPRGAWLPSWVLRRTPGAHEWKGQRETSTPNPNRSNPKMCFWVTSPMGWEASVSRRARRSKLPPALHVDCDQSRSESMAPIVR